MRASSLIALVSTLLTVLIHPGSAAAQERALLVPVRGTGADDTALQSATNSLRRRLQEQGYVVGLLESGAPTGEAAVSDLAALAQQYESSIIVEAVLQDFAGMPSLTIRVISSDGSLLGEDSNLANASTLPQDATLILANALQTVPRPPPPPTPTTTSDVESPFDTGGGGFDAESGPPQVRPAQVGPPQRRPRRRRPQWPERRFWLGALVEPAMGTNRSSFNLMTGIRGEFQWRGLTVGLDFNYTFVKDWEPRSDPAYHTMSVFGMIGYKIRLGSQRLSLPILVGGGYIPGNGGLLRFEAGIAIRPIDRLEIRAIFVCPNFWFLGEEMVLFTSLSIAILVGL